ncbi:hypothetical protein [Rhodanobacter spathiphylli]|uniref:Uncharacterized protein n=1 Tax=Rhodanobacter spathiphylli B39 TaxID=1163407 RepID=I4VRI4_9GAMM|nr:hypothetical protein [Rhodanobacter spathiphylli]EIL89825.1 hypothetical protein UU7_16352 [Rhodanobacter spathiphylli B39]
MIGAHALPPEMELIRAKALRALRDVRSVHHNTRTSSDFWADAQRTDAGRRLPEYYLVYFLLVELLGFPHKGPEEKVAWTIPLDYRGKLYTIEHRKMGLGLFIPDPDAHVTEANEIVNRIGKATKEAQPFFNWLADQQVVQSAVNVANHSQPLHQRYKYLRESAQAHFDAAEQRQAESRVATEGMTDLSGWLKLHLLGTRFEPEGDWLALSAVEAFFSWTEHALIHLAILQGRVTTASQVATLAAGDWVGKFNAALDRTEKGAATLLDRILAVRQDLRNHVAHGAFGKQGEALSFHSSAGAVPVLLPHRTGPRHFRFGNGLDFDARQVFGVLDEFEAFMFAGARAPARVFLLEERYSTVLTMVATYAIAMQSTNEMRDFLRHWGDQVDRSANMDW